MKRFIKVLSVLMAAVIFVCGIPVSAAGSASGLDRARNGVVFLESDYGYASGFAVGGDLNGPVEYIVTNAHVVGSRSDKVTVWFSVMAFDFMIAEVVALDTIRDLCVLRLPESTTKRNALPINDAVLNSGEHIYTLGYPDYGTAGQDYNTMSTNDLVMTDGIISQQVRITDRGYDFQGYMHSAATSYGNSGGPVVNSEGMVIGVTEGGTNVEGAATQGSIAIIADELTRFLSSNRIPYVSSSGGDGTLLIIIIAAAAVVIIAAVIVIIIVMKKKKTGGSGGAYAPAAAPASRGAVIIGMKGVMANRSFNINGSITIGRNAQKCNVAFPVDTKGISGVHCQIRQVSGGYEIMDCGSSNGTFLGNGQKLAPNVPTFIPDGTYFYLGSEKELFQIKY